MPAPFADNYMANVGAGAQIGNMIALRQERAMQLRSQAALNAVRERELAAQADMLEQHAQLFRSQIDQKEQLTKDTAAQLQAAQSYYRELTETQGMEPEAAQKQVDQLLVYKYPLAAAVVAKTRKDMAAAGPKAATAADLERARHNQVMEGLATQKAGAPGVEPEIRTVNNPITGQPVAAFRTSKGGWQTLESKNKSGDIGTVIDREAVKATYGRIKKLQDAYDELTPEKPTSWFQTNNKKRAQLKAQIDELTGQLQQLRAGTKGPAATQPAATGGKVVVVKDGKRYRLPAEQVEEARRQGFEVEGAAPDGGETGVQGDDSESESEDAGEQGEE